MLSKQNEQNVEQEEKNGLEKGGNLDNSFTDSEAGIIDKEPLPP